MVGYSSVYTKATARLSPCGEYRYTLTRRWHKTKTRVCWVMLNPSVADADTDDNTIRRCVAFAKQWDYGGIVVVNLFALRSTDPKQLLDHDDPIGPQNDDFIIATIKSPSVGNVVVAWGAHGALYSRDRRVLSLIEFAGYRPRCLGMTKDGFPKHPLRLVGTTPLVMYG